jgi:hypothetical protein
MYCLWYQNLFLPSLALSDFFEAKYILRNQKHFRPMASAIHCKIKQLEQKKTIRTKKPEKNWIINFFRTKVVLQRPIVMFHQQHMCWSSHGRCHSNVTSSACLFVTNYRIKILSIRVSATYVIHELYFEMYRLYNISWCMCNHNS